MKSIYIIFFLGFLTVTVLGQQDIFRQNPIVSPDIHKDGTVTFRLSAPDAQKVTISGSWMPSQGFTPGSVDMIKGEDGIWTHTTEALPSEFYRYSMNVDGVRTIDPSNAHVIRDVASVSNVFLVEGGLADLYKVHDVPHGTVTYRWYDSPGNKKQRRVAIYTPPGYESNNDKYPVLYLLHGVGGDEEAWLGSGRANIIMDNLIGEDLAEPMIVVMTNGNVAQEAAPGIGSDGFVTPTFSLPHTMDGLFEETFPDVMSFVEENYRTIETKGGRAIAGLSMGGFHTANISLHYPNTFDYIGLFSSALGVRPMGDNSSVVYQDKDAKLQRQNQNGYKVYWMGMGIDDMPMIYNGNKDFRDKMDAIGMEYTYRETDGGHTWANWRKYLAEFVPLLFK